MYLGLYPTIGILVAALGAVAFARFKANQPYEPGVPRFINWNIVMMMSALVAILMVVHLFSLSGMEVGQGRRMP